MRYLVPLAFLGLQFTQAFSAQPKTTADIPNPAVDAEAAAFIVPEGYEVSLWASEPLVRKPVQMNWDKEGRLWVVTSTTYPQIKPGDSSVDQVLVIEDTDGDGKADKSTVFAEDLHIPTAVIPVQGGCYVANSTEILFLKDTDGDGKADYREVVLSGFGTEDTHHLVHTLRFGPDGQIHFNQSIYIHSHIETPYGVRRLMGGGIWEFQPQTKKLEVVAKGLINPWGYEFDRYGQSFATDGAGSEGINYVFPGAVYATSPGAKRIIQGLNPGQPKHCGLEIIEEPHFGPDWQNSLVTCDFRGNRINRFVLTENGSGYISKQVEDVLASTHRGFRPVDARTGPDGALYIADWYNPIIQHGEVDFRDPRRDLVHGRIWKLQAKGKALAPKTDFTKKSIDELLELLKSPRRWDRLGAKQTLQERPLADVLKALDAWTEKLNLEDPASGLALLEAAWTRETLNSYSPALLRKLLSSADPKIQAAGFGILRHNLRLTPDAMKLLQKGVQSEHPQVRLWAVAGLRDMYSPQAFQTALLALDKPLDNNIDFLLELTAREQANVWLPAFLKNKITLNASTKHMVYALRSTGSSDGLPPLLKALKEGKLSPEDGASTLTMAGNVATAAQVDQLLELATQGLANKAVNEPGEPPFFSAIMNAVIQSAQRKVLPKNQLSQSLEALLSHPKPEVALFGARLAGLTKKQEARPRLEAWVSNESTHPSLRTAAIQGLTALGGPASRDFLLKIAETSTSAAQQSAAIQGLAAFAPDAAAKAASDFLQKVKTVEDASSVLSTVIQSNVLPEAVSKLLDGKTVAEAIAVEGIRMMSTRGVQGTLPENLRKAGNIKQMDKLLTPEEMKTLVAKVQNQGNPARGEAIYRRQQLLCISCHAIGETGGILGPNLVSIGASAPVDYLIESMLEPSKKIKEGYHMTMVTTKDGQVFAGAIAQDSDTELVIRDAANKLHKIRKDTIASNQISPVSMMPPGLTASLREDEFVDLIRFLSELGREGNYKTQANVFVRTWQVMGTLDRDTADHIRHVGLPSLLDKTQNYPWGVVFSKVDGSLPLNEVPALALHPWYPKIAQFNLELPSEQTIELKFNSMEHMTILVDDHELKEFKNPLPVKLSPGKHTITVLISKPGLALQNLQIEVVKGQVKLNVP